jgi:hypothetical protein
MAPQPLSDEELELVHETLEGFGDKRAMNLEQLDGFLTALLAGPEEPKANTCVKSGETILLTRMA